VLVLSQPKLPLSSSKASWFVDRCQKDDFEQIAKLALGVYGEDSALSNDAYLAWKYRSNPLGTIGAVCKDKDKIVGFTGLVPVLMKFEDTACSCAIWGDSMVDSNYRRQGIAMALHAYLIKEAVSNISMTFATNALKSPSAVGAMKHLEHIHAGDMIVLKRYISRFSALRNLWSHRTRTPRGMIVCLAYVAELLWISLTAPYHKAKNLFGFSYPESDKIQVSEIPRLSFGDEYTKLWDRAKSLLPVAVIKSPEYLNWRYANPKAAYVGFRADDAEGVLRGYCIIAYVESIFKLKAAYLADLIAEGPEVGCLLVREALKRANHDGQQLMIMWETDQSWKLAMRLAFGRSFWKHPFIARTYGQQIPERVFARFPIWSLNAADTEDWL